MNQKDSSYIYHLVSQNIKKQRKKQGMTKTKLAILANCSEGFISNIESPNYFQTFSLDTVWIFANALNIDIKLLFENLDDDQK